MWSGLVYLIPTLCVAMLGVGSAHASERISRYAFPRGAWEREYVGWSGLSRTSFPCSAWECIELVRVHATERTSKYAFSRGAWEREYVGWSG